jgi:hypothetical protein
MNGTDLAWAAGLFEGEGSVTWQPGYVGNRQPCIRLVMQMNDEDVLRRLQGILGGLISGPYLRPNAKDGCIRKPSFRWAISRQDDVRTTAALLYPLLGQRRQARFDALGIAPGHPSG